ncbi:MAG TPA: Hsp70 family protein [Polyangiales bacterium]|nr:Hsp70 family protein [Polyangiales bacterium]
MSPADVKPTIFAIDFGTSNSLLAAAAPGRVFAPAPIDPGADDPTVLRSVLYFAPDEQAFGNAAVRRLVANGLEGRLIRSIKRHLPSRAFSATQIGSRKVTIEQLVATILRAMRERACQHFETDVTRVVLGRPARFSNLDDEDQLAEQRLKDAALLAGFADVSFCPEPVAAAYDFAADLEEPKLVLVIDLGGGTSDYTLVRMSKSGFQPEDVLAVGGVAVAGDALDGALVRAVVARELGSEAPYRVPFGSNELTMPQDMIDLLSSPADLTLSDRARTLRRLTEMKRGLLDRAHEPLLEKFEVIVEDGVGFELYEAVERCKRGLSEDATSPLTLHYPGAELAREVQRSEFIQAAQRPLGRVVEALERTLVLGGVRGEDVQIACLTGGTSRVPIVREALTALLPNAQQRTLRSFHSVVQGLARRAQELA